LFDPDLTGTGHQPGGYDFNTNFFNHYIVTAARCRATFFTPSGGPVAVGVCISDDTTIPADYTTLVEEGKGSYKVLALTAVQPVELSCDFNAHDFFGINDLTAALSRIGAPVTANPSELAVFDIWAQSPTQSLSVTVNCVYTIDFWAEFSEPKDLPAS
jgi:hypothetical protein